MEKTNLQIPWKKFSEEKIQILIGMLFTSLDYNLEEWHRSDRANENGADIVAKKGKESIAIAVKIKPRHNDRPQLMELSERKEKKKIYVYIETPSKKFMKFADRYKKVEFWDVKSLKKFMNFMKGYKSIEFWDVKSLNDFFVKKDKCFAASIFFDNHKINKELQDVENFCFRIFQKVDNSKREKIRSLDEDSFFMLWRLKDISVNLNKTNELIQSLFEKPVKNKAELDSHFLGIFLNYLDLLEQKVSPFLETFEEFYEKNKALVHNSIQVRDSHWLYIRGNAPLNNPKLKQLSEQIEKKAESKELNKQLLKIKKQGKMPKKTDREKLIEEYAKKMARSNYVWQAMTLKLKNLSILGNCLEQIIDHIAKEYFQKYDTLPDQRKNR